MSIVTLTSGKSFFAASDRSILDGSIHSMVSLPYSCKTGRCSTCKCKVIKGETTALWPETGLTAEEKQAGWILSCVRAVNTDVLLEVEDLDGISLPSTKIVPCRIKDIEKLATDVIRVMLRLPPATDFNFIPGQYIDVIGPTGLSRSYSLANANFADKMLELHIRAVDGGIMSHYWFKEAKNNDLLRLNGPLGTFFLRPYANQDLIFLATGTGFAPVKAMLESLSDVSAEQQPRSVTVYWGARKYEDIYLDFKILQGHYCFVPVLSQPPENWTGAKGYVQQAVLSTHPDLHNATVYACGSNDMIQSAKAALTEAGLPGDRFYSDAFVCSATN